MARLQTLTDEYLLIEPVRYQFPNLAEQWSEYDANWLEIRMEANIAGRQWSSVDPALLTWEVASLAAWMERLGAGSLAAGDKWYAVEPCIAFRARRSADSTQRKLVVTLMAEFSDRDRGRAVKVALTVTPASLQTFAAELRHELMKFPERQVARESE